MRQKTNNNNTAIPSFMELQSMLKNLKLTEIKENFQTERVHLQLNKLASLDYQDQNKSSQYNSVIFDNFDDPNCFQEHIKAIDINTLQRNIEKKPILIEERHGEGIVQKFKQYMQTQALQKKQKSQTKVKRKIGQNYDSNQGIQSSEKSFKKSSSTLNLNRQYIHNKENKKVEANRPKIFCKEYQEVTKRKIFSNIQMHKFSDCQQLLRGVHKK